MQIREATGEDFMSFFGRDPPATIRGLVAEKDGELVGFGGYCVQGGVIFAFTNIREGKLTKREMIQGGRAIMGLLRSLGSEVVALPDWHGETVLKHFGFRRRGPIWVWSPR